MYMKYHYKDYEPILSDNMKIVEKAYEKYKLDEMMKYFWELLL